MTAAHVASLRSPSSLCPPSRPSAVRGNTPPSNTHQRKTPRSTARPLTRLHTHHTALLWIVLLSERGDIERRSVRASDG